MTKVKLGYKHINSNHYKYIWAYHAEFCIDYRDALRALFNTHDETFFAKIVLLSPKHLIIDFWNGSKNTAGLDLVIHFTFDSFQERGPYHKETSPLKWASFDIIGASVMKELNSILKYVL